jgi:preprotein translocase subunit YajC
MIAIFYFLLIRPENKKKKAVNEMRASLKVGDEITTIGGVVGTICAVKEETVVMETGADRVRIEFTKWAISSKGTQTDQDAAPAAEKKDKKDKKEKKDESAK